MARGLIRPALRGYSQRVVRPEPEDIGNLGGRPSFTYVNAPVELTPNYSLLARYRGLRHVGGCPRCNGALLAGTCLPCGWDGPTRTPNGGPGRPIQGVSGG